MRATTPKSPSTNQPTNTADDDRDAEKGSFEASGAAPKARLAGPARRDMDEDEATSIDVGKQIALESDNSIKYRTCSWQKVFTYPMYSESLVAN